MSIVEDRNSLKKIIETLTADQLASVKAYVASLRATVPAKNGELKEVDDDLARLIKSIQQTPVNPENIQWATKTMTPEILEGLSKQVSHTDSAEWDAQWDELERQLKAESLAHDAQERALW